MSSVFETSCLASHDTMDSGLTEAAVHNDCCQHDSGVMLLGFKLLTTVRKGWPSLCDIV